MLLACFFFFFKQKTAYEMLRSLVGSEMCIRDSTRPVAASAGRISSSPASGRCAPSVNTTGASTNCPVRASARSLVRGSGAGSTGSLHRPVPEITDRGRGDRVGDLGARRTVRQGTVRQGTVRHGAGRWAGRLWVTARVRRPASAGHAPSQRDPHRGRADLNRGGDRGPCVPPVSYTHLRAHETPEHLVCRLLLEKKKTKK